MHNTWNDMRIHNHYPADFLEWFSKKYPRTYQEALDGNRRAEALLAKMADAWRQGYKTPTQYILELRKRIPSYVELDYLITMHNQEFIRVKLPDLDQCGLFYLASCIDDTINMINKWLVQILESHVKSLQMELATAESRLMVAKNMSNQTRGDRPCPQPSTTNVATPGKS